MTILRLRKAAARRGVIERSAKYRDPIYPTEKETTMPIRRAVTVAAAVLLGLGGSVTLVAPASATTGSVNMQAACDNQYPGQGRIAKIRTWNVYGWKCTTGVVPVPDGDIDVWRQCRKQYNNPNARGDFTDFNNPYSWYCIY